MDFKIKGDHPACGTFLDRIQAKLLTFLDENKTKALVASAVENLHTVTNISFPPSTEKIVFDIRPLRLKEQIDSKIFESEVWKHSEKSIDIFIVPNIEPERTEKYLEKIKNFLSEQHVDLTDFIIDKYSNTGLLTVKMDRSLTTKMLDEASFVYRVNETPKISKEYLQTGHNNSEATSESNLANITAHRAVTKLQALPEVCMVDSGLNSINPLRNIISTKSHEANMPDDKDYDDHGTSVAYLVAYGEGNQPRARIISHKIVSGSNESNLFAAIARAITTYRHRARVFTCSITFRDDDDAANFESWKIDRLAQASNACIIFSAGNIRTPELTRFSSLGLNYPAYFDHAPVMPPSNSPSILCVGSCSLRSDHGISIAPENSPSPFTRYKTRCRSMGDCVKPEIVEHGGNLNANYSYNGIGVDTYTASGVPTQKVGTSFSTPIIAGHVAEIVQKYGKKIQNAETFKAVLLSSCVPTGNYPRFVGFGKPNCVEMLSSNFETAKIIFEGEIKLSNSQLRRNVPANKISVYIPVGVDKIELFLVHSDNYNIPSHLGLYTYIEVAPEKPARDTPPPPDIGDLSSKDHVKRLVWNYQKAARGVWFFTFVPHHIGIPLDKRENVTLRYGGVLKLTASRSGRISLIDELRRNLKEYLYA